MRPESGGVAERGKYNPKYQAAPGRERAYQILNNNI